MTLRYLQENIAENGYGAGSFLEKELSKVAPLWYRSARSV
jgi:hypothetical protein